MKINVRKLIEKSFSSLEKCREDALKDSNANLVEVRKTIEETLNKGQLFLDSLSECSKGPLLQLVPCYRGIILKDVIPTKMALLSGIQGHKTGYERMIEIRDKANECVDETVAICHKRINSLAGKSIDTTV